MHSHRSITCSNDSVEWFFRPAKKGVRGLEAMSVKEQENDVGELSTQLSDFDSRDSASMLADSDLIAHLTTTAAPKKTKHLKLARLLRQVFNKPAKSADSLTCLASMGDQVVAKQVQQITSLSSPPKQIGRFEVRGVLGSGGCGVVFQAWDPVLFRMVALKVPRVETLFVPERRARFKQEARLAGGLAHPNIVPVFEAGEEGPVCYIASEYCHGESLAHWLEGRKDPVPFDVCAQILIALAEGVAHAHARGVLHRDLKPGNVILQSCDRSQKDSDLHSDTPLPFVPRVTDFGLAKISQADADDITQEEDDCVSPASMHTHSEIVMGTPAYMSPEQARGGTRDVTTAADIYSLGAILYELITGTPPYSAPTPPEVLRKVIDEEPATPNRLRKRVPRDLETICMKCLEKQPNRRYASAAELAQDLRRYLTGDNILARPISTGERIGRWCKKNPLSAALIGAVVTACLLGFAGIGWHLDRIRQEVDL